MAERVGRISIACENHWHPADFFETEAQIELCQAITDRDESAVEMSIASGIDLNRQGKFGFTVLYWAFAEYNLSAFRRLLGAGADPDLMLTHDLETDKSPGLFWRGDSVLFTSLHAMKPTYSSEAIRFSSAPNQTDRAGQNLLHLFFFHNYGFGGAEMLQTFLDAGVDVNQKSPRGIPICQTALAFGNVDLCIQLLNAGADPKATNAKGQELLALVDLRRKGKYDVKWDLLAQKIKDAR